jgi:hypothetical protein
MKPYLNLRDWAVTQAAVAVVLFLLVPLFNMFGATSYPWASVLHGLGATITVLLGCQAIHRTYPLLRGKAGSAARLELLLWTTSVLVLLTIILGNWLYIGYRQPDGGQQWLMYHEPAGHMIAMEYKEFVSLFPLPLGIAAAWLLRRYRTTAESHPGIASVVALLVTLLWICLLIGLVFGLGITKLIMV